MAGARVACANCRRSWALPAEDSVFMHLDVESRPCPFCEGYTLVCHAAEPARSGPRARRRLRPRGFLWRTEGWPGGQVG